MRTDGVFFTLFPQTRTKKREDDVAQPKTEEVAAEATRERDAVIGERDAAECRALKAETRAMEAEKAWRECEVVVAGVRRALKEMKLEVRVEER